MIIKSAEINSWWQEVHPECRYCLEKQAAKQWYEQLGDYWNGLPRAARYGIGGGLAGGAVTGLLGKGILPGLLGGGALGAGYGALTGMTPSAPEIPNVLKNRGYTDGEILALKEFAKNKNIDFVPENFNTILYEYSGQLKGPAKREVNRLGSDLKRYGSAKRRLIDIPSESEAYPGGGIIPTSRLSGESFLNRPIFNNIDLKNQRDVNFVKQLMRRMGVTDNEIRQLMQSELRNQTPRAKFNRGVMNVLRNLSFSSPSVPSQNIPVSGF